MTELDIQIGDKITIGGVCKGGVIREGAPESDLQPWRVKAIEGDDIVLQPLLPSGEVDEFNDVCGDFRIVRKSKPLN